MLNNVVSHAALNNTHIVLIPKKKKLSSPIDFRPISLCNISLKIITKTTANLLKSFFPNIIGPSQSVFVPGHLISDNALIDFEIFHHMKLHLLLN